MTRYPWVLAVLSLAAMPQACTIAVIQPPDGTGAGHMCPFGSNGKADTAAPATLIDVTWSSAVSCWSGACFAPHRASHSPV